MANSLISGNGVVHQIARDFPLPPYVKAWLQLKHYGGPTFHMQRSAAKEAKKQFAFKTLRSSPILSIAAQDLPQPSAHTNSVAQPNHSNIVPNGVGANVSQNKDTPRLVSSKSSNSSSGTYVGVEMSSRNKRPICGQTPTPFQGKGELKGQFQKATMGGVAMERGNGDNKAFYGLSPTMGSMPPLQWC
jgi:hypothetical protein